MQNELASVSSVPWLVYNCHYTDAPRAPYWNLHTQPEHIKHTIYIPLSFIKMSIGGCQGPEIAFDQMVNFSLCTEEHKEM